VSDESHARAGGGWGVAMAAALLAGGLVMGVGGLAYAGDGADDVGAPGEDGEDVTCIVHEPSMESPPCNAVGEDGADGASSTDD
jgi:hypothetical protein